MATDRLFTFAITLRTCTSSSRSHQPRRSTFAQAAHAPVAASSSPTGLPVIYISYNYCRNGGCNYRSSLFVVCGRVYSDANGRIVSPGWPGNYRANMQCDFTVDVEEGRSIALYFHAFRLEGSSTCNYDSLKVRAFSLACHDSSRLTNLYSSVQSRLRFYGSSDETLSDHSATQFVGQFDFNGFLVVNCEG